MSGKDKRIEESMMRENQISPLPPKKEDSERRARWPSHNCLLSKKRAGGALFDVEGVGRASSDESRTESRPPPIEVSFNMGYRLENRYSCSGAPPTKRERSSSENDGFTIGFVFLTPTSTVSVGRRAGGRSDRQLQFHTPLVTPPYITVRVSSPNLGHAPF